MKEEVKNIGKKEAAEKKPSITKQAMQKNANEYYKLLNEYGEETTLNLTKELIKYEQIDRMGSSASDNNHWNAIADILRNRDFPDVVNQISEMDAENYSGMSSKEFEDADAPFLLEDTEKPLKEIKTKILEKLRKIDDELDELGLKPSEKTRILLHRAIDNTISIYTESENNDYMENQLKMGISRYSLEDLIRQQVAYERLMRNGPTTDKLLIWGIGADELKKRGYGRVVHNIKDMHDPSDSSEINEILQSAYSHYPTFEEDATNKEFYQHLKDKRVSLHDNIMQVIDNARKDKYPISRMEILGTLELVKLFFFKHGGKTKFSDTHNDYPKPGE